MSMELKQKACAVVDGYHRVEVLDDEASKLLAEVEQILTEGGVRFYAMAGDGDLGYCLEWSNTADSNLYHLVGGLYGLCCVGYERRPWRECDQKMRVAFGKLLPVLLEKLVDDIGKTRKSSLSGS